MGFNSTGHRAGSAPMMEFPFIDNIGPKSNHIDFVVLFCSSTHTQIVICYYGGRIFKLLCDVDKLMQSNLIAHTNVIKNECH